MIARAWIAGSHTTRTAGAALVRIVRPRRGRAVGAALVIALAVAGCTPIPRVVTRPGAPVSRADSSGVAPGTGPVSAVIDSAPSPAALAVLSSIPEPLAPEERVPPPEITITRDGSAAEAAPEDSQASAAGDTTSAVPVPAPTPKLGDVVNPGLDPARDTTATRGDSVVVTPQRPKQGAGDPSTQPPREQSTLAPAAACWRVQVLAPKEKAEADRKRSAAESILLVPMVVEREAGLYKIRTRECFPRATADVVRGRAVASGFPGAFPFESVKR